MGARKDAAGLCATGTCGDGYTRTCSRSALSSSYFCSTAVEQSCNVTSKERKLCKAAEHAQMPQSLPNIRVSTAIFAKPASGGGTGQRWNTRRGVSGLARDQAIGAGGRQSSETFQLEKPLEVAHGRPYTALPISRIPCQTLRCAECIKKKWGSPRESESESRHRASKADALLCCAKVKSPRRLGFH